MVAFTADHGTIEAPDFLIRALVKNAERRAEATAAVLDATGLFPAKPVYLPATFLLELGAVVQLALWERSGLRPYLPADLPAYAQAAGALGRRAMKGPAEFANPNDVPLHRHVLKVWLEHFAWDGPQELQADVLLGHVDEDRFADVLADFVWKHRYELSSLLDKY